MKSTDFKKIIKQAVKEAIQEELKDILLEAVRSPKTIVKESYQAPVTPQVNLSSQPPVDLRKSYMDVLGETALSFTSNDAQTFNPRGVDPVNGTLPSGDLGMDQIMNLMGSK